jgi:hypothetical protein
MPISALEKFKLGHYRICAGRMPCAVYLGFALKGADPDIPILKQAKLEYLKLQ